MYNLVTAVYLKICFGVSTQNIYKYMRYITITAVKNFVGGANPSCLPTYAASYFTVSKIPQLN